MADQIFAHDGARQRSARNRKHLYELLGLKSGPGSDNEDRAVFVIFMCPPGQRRPCRCD